MPVPTIVIDGGDLGCGELLLLVHRAIRRASAGTRVAITTSDPAAEIDLPAWCHLTGHRYRGPAPAEPDGPGRTAPSSHSRAFIVELVDRARPVDPDRPWHLRAPHPKGI